MTSNRTEFETWLISGTNGSTIGSRPIGPTNGTNGTNGSTTP